MNLEDNKNFTSISGTAVKIIGFGNKFLSDDGIGPYVIKELEKTGFSKDKNIEILDLGTSGFDLIFHIKECPRIIIVDALDAGQDTGKVIKINEEDIQQYCDEGMRSLSLHDLNLADMLMLSRALKLKTEITIIGIKPLNIEFGDGLSPEIEEKVPEMISLISETLKQYKILDKKQVS